MRNGVAALAAPDTDAVSETAVCRNACCIPCYSLNNHQIRNNFRWLEPLVRRTIEGKEKTRNHHI